MRKNNASGKIQSLFIQVKIIAVGPRGIWGVWSLLCVLNRSQRLKLSSQSSTVLIGRNFHTYCSSSTFQFLISSVTALNSCSLLRYSFCWFTSRRIHHAPVRCVTSSQIKKKRPLDPFRPETCFSNTHTLVHTYMKPDALAVISKEKLRWVSEIFQYCLLSVTFSTVLTFQPAQCIPNFSYHQWVVSVFHGIQPHSSEHQWTLSQKSQSEMTALLKFPKPPQKIFICQAYPACYLRTTERR